MPKIFHPLLQLIASATDPELAKYVEYLKEENKILRARIPGQIHTRPDERKRLLKLGKRLGRAIEELITIVLPQGDSQESFPCRSYPGSLSRDATDRQGDQRRSRCQGQNNSGKLMYVPESSFTPTTQR
jgi:hypothetical protein